METKNVFQKLQSARVKLSELKLEKSGENKFSHYFYFELSDFLPSIQKIFNDIQLIGLTSFTTENATLTVINSDKPEENIVFNSPMAGVDLRGMHAIQNMGAVETYQRRYLYMMALEITEPDALDSKDNSQKPQLKPEVKPEVKPEPKPEHPNKPSNGLIVMTDEAWVKYVARLNGGELLADKIRKAFVLTPAQNETLKKYEEVKKTEPVAKIETNQTNTLKIF